MPTLNQVSTVGSKVVWQSPDGQRKLHEVDLTFQGKPFKAKTYSGAIAQIGWTGDVTTEERQGKYGAEIYVKQPQQEGGYQGAGKVGGDYQKAKPQSNTTMFVSYAKDIVVALQTTEGFSEDKFNQLLSAVIDGGRILSQADYDAKAGAVPGEPVYVPVDGVVDPDSVELKQQLDDISWLNDLPKE